MTERYQQYKKYKEQRDKSLPAAPTLPGNANAPKKKNKFSSRYYRHFGTKESLPDIKQNVLQKISEFNRDNQVLVGSFADRNGNSNRTMGLPSWRGNLSMNNNSKPGISFDSEGKYESGYRNDSNNFYNASKKLNDKIDIEVETIDKLIRDNSKLFDNNFIEQWNALKEQSATKRQGIMEVNKVERDMFGNYKTEDEFKAAYEEQLRIERLRNVDFGHEAKELEGIRQQIDIAGQRQSDAYLALQDAEMAIANAFNSNDTNEQELQMDVLARAKEEYDAATSEYNGLNEELNERRKYYEEAREFQKEDRLTTDALNDPIFEEIAQQGLDIENPTWFESKGSMSIFGWQPFAEKVKNKYTFEKKYQGELNDIGSSTHYNLMTEKEGKIYSYWLIKNPQKADAYLASLEDVLAQRSADNFMEKYGNDQSIVEDYTYGFIAGVDNFSTSVKNLFSDEEYYNTNSLQLVSGGIRDKLADDGAEILGSSIGQIGYDFFNTAGNMLPAILTSTALSIINPVAGQAAGALLMGASASGNAYAEMINLGYDKDQARTYSLLVGGSEAGLQFLMGGISKLGGKVTNKTISNAISKIDNVFARTAIQFGGSLLSEGTEEYLQVILEPFFKNIAFGEKNDIRFVSEEALYNGLLGMLSAGAFEGGSIVSSNVDTYRTGKRLMASGITASQLSEVGSKFSADSVAYKLANNVTDNTGAYTLGEMFKNMNATMSQQNKIDIVNILVNKGVLQSDAEVLVDSIERSMIAGEDIFTAKEKYILDNNPALNEAVKEVLIDKNTTLYQRITGMAEINKQYTAKQLQTIADKISKGEDIDNIEETIEETDVSESVLDEENISEAMEQAVLDEDIQKLVDVIEDTDKTVGLEDINDNDSPLSEYTEEYESESESEQVDEEYQDNNEEPVGQEQEKESASATAYKIAAKGESPVAQIASTKDGKVKYKTEDGTIVDSDNAKFKNKDEALIYETALDMGLPAHVVNYAVKAYDPQLSSAVDYITGFRMAYEYGALGVKRVDVPYNEALYAYGDKFTTQIHKLGRDEALQETINAAVDVNDALDVATQKNKNKKGKVYMDGKEYTSNGRGLTKIQKVSIKAVKFLAEVLGNDIHLYNSYVATEGKFKGLRVYKNVNGEVVLAPNGFYNPDGSINIDINAGNMGEGVILETLSHELTHHIKKWSPFKYKDMADFLFQQYARHEHDVEALIDEQQAKALKNGRKISRETAQEEVVADAFSRMLTDTDAIRKLAQKDKSLFNKIKAWIKNICAKINKLYAKYEPQTKEAQYVRQFQGVAETLQKYWLEGLEDAAYNYKSVDSSQLNKTGETKYSYSSIAYSFFGKENVKIEDFENGSFTKTEGYKNYVSSCLNNMRQTMGKEFNESEARNEIEDSIKGIVKVAVEMKKAGYDILDNHEKRGAKDSKKRLLFSSLEPNSDYFTSSDISTICDKRINFASIYDEIVRREAKLGVPKGKRFFDNVDNYFVIHKIMAEKGLTQPCRQCYVESMRKNLAPMANAFLKLMQETNPNNKSNDQLYHVKGKQKGEIKSNNAELRSKLLEAITAEEYDITADKLTVEMLTTEDGLTQLKLQAPLVYEAFNSFYGQSKPKMPKSATPFRFGELTAMLTDNNGKIKTGTVNKIIATGGFRLQSYSDFQIQNFADVLQVIFEAGTLGLNGHAYTKVPAFLEATKDTNLKRNISIFMYNDNGRWLLDKNDSFPYELEEIYDIVNSDKKGNTSIVAVVQNEKMAAWVMANDNIGFFIPFHKSGLKMGTVRDTIVKEGGRNIKGYSDIKDHTRQQTEVWAKTTADHKALTKVKKGINIYSEEVGWDFDNIENLPKNKLIEKNIKAYIDACERAGYLPKFREYVMNNTKVLNSVLNYSKELGFVSQDATIDDISFNYKGYQIPYGYYKCLGDFGMFTPEGKASPIERLTLKNYNFEEAVKFFSDAETLRRTEILQQIANGSERVRYLYGDKKNMTTAEIAEEIQSKRNEVVDEVVSGEHKDDSKQSDKREVETENQVLYSDRDTDGGFSQRSLLANALESTAESDQDKKTLAQYKKNIAMLSEAQDRLQKVNAKIKELSSGKGKRDTEQLANLKRTAKELTDLINRYDKKLFSLESTDSLKRVLEVERKRAYAKAVEKGKNNLQVYKDKMVQREQNIRDKYQKSKAEAIEKRSKTEMKNKIKKLVSKLDSLLRNQTKEKHIPIYYQKSVAQMLKALNLDEQLRIARAEKRMTAAEEKYTRLMEEEKAKENPDAELIEYYQQKLDENTNTVGKVSEAIQSIKDAYHEITSSNDPIYVNNPEVENLLDGYRQYIGDTQLSKMTLKQLDYVYNSFKIVDHMISEANKGHKLNRSKTISDYSEEFAGEVRESHETKTRTLSSIKIGKSEIRVPHLLSKFKWDYKKPWIAIRSLGSKVANELYDNLRKGEDTWAVDIQNATKKFEELAEKYEINKWNFDKKFKCGNVEITLDQLLSLYAYSKREAADEHLAEGGFVFDSSVKLRKGKNGIFEYQITMPEPQTVSKTDMIELMSNLNDDMKELKAWADEMQDYLSSDLSAIGNEVSRELYGINLFNEKHYFPIKVMQEVLDFNAEKHTDIVPNITNMGMTKPVLPNANNTIVLGGFTDIWARHCNDMAKYHAFALAMDDFTKVYNYGKGAQSFGKSVKVAIKNAKGLGDAANKYIQTFLQDVNGGVRADEMQGIDALISKFKKSSVMASASVVIQQPSAIGRAFGMINPIYFVKTDMNINHAKTVAEMEKYAPIAIIKRLGGFDTNTSGKTSDVILGKDNKGLIKKSNNALGYAPQKADEFTWCAIWKACKREAKHKYKLEGEELLKKAGERFAEVIQVTQVYDSVFSRNAMMRSKSKFNKMVIAFMAEPITTMNDAVYAVQQMRQGNKKAGTSMLLGGLTSLVINSVLSSIVYAWRDDDEDETYAEKFISSAVGETVEGLNPITYLPILKDIYSLAQGYDVERTDMALVSDVIDKVGNIITAYSNREDDMTDEELAEAQKEIEQAWIDAGFEVLNIFGIPADNLRREIVGIAQTVTRDNDYETTWSTVMEAISEKIRDAKPFGRLTDDESKSDKIYQAIAEGDTEMLKRLKDSYKTEKAYESAMRQGLRDNDERIKAAAKAGYEGNERERVRICKEIIAEGLYSQDMVVKAVNAEINKLAKDEPEEEKEDTPEYESDVMYKASDINDAIEYGDIEGAYEIIGELVEDRKNKYLFEAEQKGERLTEREAEKKAKSSLKSTLTSHWKDIYIEAHKNGDDEECKRIRQILGNSELWDRKSEVSELCRNWLKEARKK